MKHPWEETWRWGGESADHHTIFGEEGGDVVAEFEMRSPYSNEEGAEYDYAALATKLAAAAPEMARLLLEIQWASQEGDEGSLSPQCLFCLAYANARWEVPFDTTSRLLTSDHKPDCRLIAVLRKAGVIADKDAR